MHMSHSPWCTTETNTVLWSNYTPIKIYLKKKKNTMRHHHLIPIKMALIKTKTKTKKTTENNKCWWGCRKIGTLVHCWWQWKMVQPPWKTIWWFLKKLNIEFPFNPAIPLLGIYTKEVKTQTQTDIWTLMFTAALFTLVKSGSNSSVYKEMNG